MKPKSSWLPLCVVLLSALGRASGEPAAPAASLRDLDRIPVPRHFVFPACPDALRAVSDRVEVTFFIDEQGAVKRPAVLSGQTPALCQAALDAIAEWRFDPPLRQGQPVRVAASQVFVFTPAPAAGGRAGPVIPVSWGPANWAGDTSQKIYDVAVVEQAPEPIEQPAPHYPRGGDLPRTVGGSTLVDFVVDTQGRVHNAFAVTSTHQQFEDAAVQAVSRWVFKPGRKGGVPVNVHLEQRMDYVALVRVTAWGDLQNIRANPGRQGMPRSTPSPGPIRINQ